MSDLNISLPLSATRHSYDPEASRAQYAANAELIPPSQSTSVP